MTSRWSAFLAALAAFGVGAFIGCSSSEDAQLSDSASGGNGGNGGQSSAGAAGEDTGLDPDAGEPGRPSPFTGESCADGLSEARLLPLDMYLMLDASGSMLLGQTAGDTTRWDAVTTALSEFAEAESSEGLSMALQFFPLLAPDVPESCYNLDDCGIYGPCFLFGCTGEFSPCLGDGHCPQGQRCVVLGTCTNAPSTLCEAATQCPAGGGLCRSLPTSICLFPEECSQTPYATPAVDFQPLPAGAPELIASMTAYDPENATPTAPALAGAIQAASARALARRDRTVVTVLATDGFPTTCWGLGVDTAEEAVDEVASIAAEGLANDPSVPTFVIGVFTPEEEAEARAALDAVAIAGGSQRAFLVNTAGDVGSGFREALEAIRESTPGCDYSIPEPEDGAELDYTKVNVQFSETPDEDPQTLYYVGGSEACTENAGGWYYDVPLDSADPPARIIICEETCELFRDAPSGAVSISIGCESIAAPPR